MKPTLSVVVPVGARDNSWHSLLPQLQHLVADEIALVLPIDCMGDAIPLADERLMFMVAPLGRARQLNAGAGATRSDWLWFLDPDSRLEVATLRTLNTFVADDAASAGLLDLRGARDRPRRTVPVSTGTRSSGRWAAPPMGNQGLFMPRRVYDAIGGFDESLEDGAESAFVRRARQSGIRSQDHFAAPFAGVPKGAGQRGWRAMMENLGLNGRPARALLQADTTP